MDLTAQQREAMRQVMLTIEEAIRDLSQVSPLGGVSSGELYARFSSLGISFGTYQAILGALSQLGRIKVSNNLITYTRS